MALTAQQSISLGPQQQIPALITVLSKVKTFPEMFTEEKIHTFDSITASGGTGILRMTLSPLCTGKIICRHNALS